MAMGPSDMTPLFAPLGVGPPAARPGEGAGSWFLGCRGQGLPWRGLCLEVKGLNALHQKGRAGAAGAAGSY